jgi:hypothetical protein
MRSELHSPAVNHPGAENLLSSAIENAAPRLVITASSVLPVN